VALTAGQRTTVAFSFDVKPPEASLRRKRLARKHWPPEKRTSPFAGTARRVLRTNGDCPFFPLAADRSIKRPRAGAARAGFVFHCSASGSTPPLRRPAGVA